MSLSITNTVLLSSGSFGGLSASLPGGLSLLSGGLSLLSGGLSLLSGGLSLLSGGLSLLSGGLSLLAMPFGRGKLRIFTSFFQNFYTVSQFPIFIHQFFQFPFQLHVFLRAH